MINCQSCGALNNEEAICCIACNRTLLVICPKCGCKNPTSAVTCHQCRRILVEKSDPRIVAKRAGDPVADMYEKRVRYRKKEYPQGAFIKIIFGILFFALVHLSPLFSGNPLVVLLVALFSGVMTLWGLVDLAFWFLSEEARQESKPVEKDKEHYPAYSKSLVSGGESFEQLDKTTASSPASSPTDELDLLIAAEQAALKELAKESTAAPAERKSFGMSFIPSCTHTPAPSVPPSLAYTSS